MDEPAIVSAGRAAGTGRRPMVWAAGTGLVGCDPVLILGGPNLVTCRLLSKSGVAMGDIDVLETDEAFASVVRAWARTLDADMAAVNPNGGATSLGHRLGGSGCFLVTKTVHELQRSAGRYGLVTMCSGGGGLGTGTLLERA